MKRILFIIFLIAGIVNAQEFGDPSFYDSTSSLSYNSTFQVRHGGQTKSLTWYRLNQLLTSGDELLVDDNTWTGTNNFTGALQIPSTLASSLSNGVGYNSGLFSWVESGAVKTGADRAWVLQQIADSGYAVDTNNFAILSGDNAFTGNNTFTGTDTFTGLKVASSVNSGNLKIPYYSGSTPSAVAGALYYDQLNNRLRAYDSPDGWRTFLDSANTVSLFQTGSFLPSSGTITGVTPQITFATGNYGIIFNTSNILVLPYQSDPSTMINGELGYGSGGQLYFYKEKIPDWGQVQGIVDSTLSSNAPTDSTDIDAIVDWTNKNYIQSIYGSDVESTTTITVSGYTSGWVTFVIDDNSSTITLTIAGVTIEWVGGTTPTFADNRTYEVTLKYLTSTRCLGSYTWYE